ncbi:MAG: hypothetical protein ACQSGP_02500 [Frankia sp.]
MNDDGVDRGLDEIAALLPPRSTEYRSGTFTQQMPAGSRDEPATVPLTIPTLPLPRSTF